MKISVIIPAHNEESNISNAIQALLKQDYDDFEVIVINNSSTDNTYKVAKSFPVTVITESRKGTMWACERGRKEANGDIIVRMDADCLPSENWLKNGVQAFKNPRVVAVTGPYDYFDANYLFNTSSLIVQKYIYSAVNYTMQILKCGAVLIGGNSFMKASALNAVGGFNTNIVFYGDDSDTAKRLATIGEVVFNKNLQLRTSARRFKAEGIIQLTIKYIYHFFRTIF